MPIVKTYGRLKVKQYAARDEMGLNAAMEAAETITGLLNYKDEINVIFAAAPSQNEFLDALVSNKDIDFTRINAYHMDEYIGLQKDAPQGFGNFLKDRLFSKAPFKSVHYINGQAEDPEAECARYNALIRSAHIDIVFMGIGENAHIAFNDPHEARFDDEEYVKTVVLDEACRRQQVNDGCFSCVCQVPEKAITLTIPALIDTDYIFCVVPAKTKAEAVRNCLQMEISEKYPASILRTKENAVMYLDGESGSLLV